MTKLSDAEFAAWAAEKVLIAWATHAAVFLAVFALCSKGPIGSDGARRAVASAILATAGWILGFGVILKWIWWPWCDRHGITEEDDR